MSLSVDDEVTLVEVAVIVIGIIITWIAYRWPQPARDSGRGPDAGG